MKTIYKKKVLCILLALTMVLTLIPTVAFAAEITTGNATVTAPVAGETPSFTATPDDPSEYSVKVLRWIDVENSRDITQVTLNDISSPYHDYKFESGKKYEVVVEFTAVGGNTLSYDNSFTINGKTTNYSGDGLKRTCKFTATAAGTEIEAVSFTYTGYAAGENVADAVVTCNTAGVEFTYKWQYSDSGGSYSDATKLSAQFISGIKYTLWIYFKAQDGLALAELNETDVTLGGNNPGGVYTNYTIDEMKYSYGVPFSMSPLGGVTKYIVGFYTQGGKIGDESYRVELVTGTDGKLAAEQVPTPTKEHYIFAGWYTAESGGTLLSLDTVYTDPRNQFYARWVPAVDIDVTFDANGGKVNGKDTDTITIPAADKGKLASLPVPTREGYTFDGWYTAASGGMKITETTVFSEATTVYALWGAIDSVSFSYTGYTAGENVADAVVTCNTAGVEFTYKWQYSDSGGSYSDATKLSAQFISGIKYTLWIYFKAQDGLALAELNETDVTLGGNNPGGVYTNYTIDEMKYSYGVPFSMSPLGGVTKYIVGFYTQGGKIGDESYRVELVTGTDGKLTAEQVPTPTKEHYTFDGWYTAASGGTLLSLDTVYTDSSSEYYARWVPTVDINVTFDANGGSGTMADVTGISGEYTLPANGFTAPAGKQFKAWSVGGVEKAAGDKITVTADTTVTAVWEDKPISGGGGGGGGAAPATPQKPEIKPVTGGKVSLSADGTTATITPDAGKVVDKVLVNGKDMGAVTELKGLKTGDKIEVLFKDEVKEPSKAETDKQVKAHMQKLAPKARSLKTKAGNVKVSFEGQFKDIEALGYTVKYKFYRSTKKASGYKYRLTTSKPSYTNTGGKKGTLYYYKAIALAYDKDGKLIAKTELKQCRYACRRWSK